MSLELLAIEGALLLGSWAYHRWLAPSDSPNPQDEIQIPLTADGTPYPLIYGRCRVRQPILAWAGNAEAVSVEDVSALDADTYYQGAQYLYYSEFLFNIGIGFEVFDGVQPSNAIHSIYAGDERLPDGPYSLLEPPANYSRLSELVGNGNYEGVTSPCFVWAHYDLAEEKGSEWEIGGLVEFLNGKYDQQLVDPTTPYAATTVAGERIGTISDPSEIPGFRGMLSVFLGGRDNRWGLGSSGRMQAMSFEVASYPTLNFGSPTIGLEANPVDVLYDLLTGKRGKLGISQSLIDTTSWQAAADTLYAEGNGYSRAIPAARALDVVREILAQIDGVIRPNYDTNKLELKLIRPDFKPADLLHITVDNCESVSLAEAFGWGTLPNRFRLTFQDRTINYQDNSATAANEGNAYGQSDAEELQIQMPGVCTLVNALKLVAREASIRSMPLMRLRATVSNAFRSLGVGDPVALSWPTLNISGAIFRVATPIRGGRDDNKIELNLIQDTGYTHRSATTDTGGLPSHPGEAVG